MQGAIRIFQSGRNDTQSCHSVGQRVGSLMWGLTEVTGLLRHRSKSDQAE